MKNSLSRYVFASKYPKYLPEQQRRETYIESVDRVMDMHQAKIHQAKMDLTPIRTAYSSKIIAGSQRGLQFGGTAIEEKNSRLYNCVVSYCDRPSFFGECFWLLLCGCGAGFSVQKHHVASLPKLLPPQGSTSHIIEDSIEGWADAVHALTNAYFYGTAFPLFSFERIRPKGASLRHGGLAPGHAPLQKALLNARTILDAATNRKLRPIEAFDITMHLADAVISGGIRRSATIAAFSADDSEMINAKTGNWFNDNPQRGRANISAMLLPHHSQAQFDELFQATKQFGEPGFIFSKSTEYLYNPCVEIGMCPTLIKLDGRTVQEYTPALLDPTRRKEWNRLGYTFQSGWQMCNLTTINCSLIHTDEEFLDAVSLATTLGTIQASYTDLPYLGSVSEEIVRRESLLGVSMTGILSHPRFYDPTLLAKGRSVAFQTNKEIASKLGIPEASRITCVKPEGTASIVLGTSAGIHPYHAKKYIRRVQADMLEPLYQEVQRTHPSACFKSVWGAASQRIVAFPCEAPPSSLVKADLSALSHLAIAKDVNMGWVRGSNVPRCHDLHHNVSITASVHPDEWEAVQSYIWENREFFTGISLLSTSGDYDYEQSPYAEVYDNPDPSDPHYLEKIKVRDLYYSLSALPDINLDEVHEDEDNTDLMGEQACGGKNSCDLSYFSEIM
jgi:ribonucleoside-diphosphate reductase alpha chain